MLNGRPGRITRPLKSKHTYRDGCINLNKKAREFFEKKGTSDVPVFIKHEKFKMEIQSKINFKVSRSGVRIIGNNKKIARAFKDFGWTRDQSINVDIEGKNKIHITLCEVR